MYSQSWLNSCTKVGAYCRTDGTTVVDVLESLYGDNTVEWSTTNDHAKWAITSDAGSSTVCLADNNRCTSQYVRGGLAQCFVSAELHEVLYTGTKSVDVCDGTDDDNGIDDNGIDDTPASTCAEIGCGNYLSSALCACNDSCETYGDCCDDFETLCGAGSDDDAADDKTDDDKLSDDSLGTLPRGAASWAGPASQPACQPACVPPIPRATTY